MKKQVYISLLFSLAMLSGCQDKLFEEFSAYSPIYMSYDDLRQAVKTESSKTIEKPGKIYFKDDYLFINEYMKGVHLFDVSDPANPQNKGFINVPGNVDIAIKENVLYADSYVDLVAIDVSDLNNIHEVGRVEDVLPYTIPEHDESYRLAEIDQEKGVVVNWEIKEIRRELKEQNQPLPIYYNYYGYAEKLNQDGAYFTTANSGVGGGSGTTFGVGGSMARFGLYKDFLYTVGDHKLVTFKINDLENPQDLGYRNIGWNVETMFIYDDHMFFGTTNGMLVYSLANAEDPAYVSQYNHVTSCDPVVVQGNLAYVTLRDGRTCRGDAVNRLDVLEIKNNYASLSLLKSYPMTNPHGLGIDGDILFVCDGDAGLKVFDASNPSTILSNKLAEFPDINAYDVIPLNNYLFMIGEGGFYLYDYSNLQNIRLLSTIPISEADN